MRNNIKLAVSYIRYYKKQAAVLFLGICMSVLLLNGIASLVNSNYHASYEGAKEEYGSWNYRIAVSKALAADNRIIRSDKGYELKHIGVYYALPYRAGSRNITLCYGDRQYMQMHQRVLLEGKYPQNANEAALDYYALHNLGADDTLGSRLEIAGTEYVLTGILSEGAKAADSSLMVFTAQKAVAKLGAEPSLYLEFAGGRRAYSQLDAFLQKNQISLSDDWEINDGIASYAGAEPKETLLDIVLTALHLEDGKLIYLLGTLESSRNLLQKMVFAVMFLFGAFMVNSILQVMAEKRKGQYGLLEVLGIDEKNMFATLLTELAILFLPAYMIGAYLGNALARAIFTGTFKISADAVGWGFVLFGLFLMACCAGIIRTMRKFTQVEKMKGNAWSRSRKLVSLKKHNLTGTLSRRLLLADKAVFVSMVLSLSLGGVLFVSTTYAAGQAKQNQAHAMLTDESLYTDLRVFIDDDDLGNVIPRSIVEGLKKERTGGIREIFPVSYTLGEIPLNHGIFKWTSFYPEIDEHADVKQDEHIMETYNGIATKQSASDYKLKVNVYGYEEQQLAALSDYLLEGSISYGSMRENNQVVLKTLMDGAGYYDGIRIHAGDHITLKVPKKTANGTADLLKFQGPDENYIEKDFVVSALVSRCTGETDTFIGSGTDIVSIIMPQQMMESNFDIADYNSIHINLEENADSEEASRQLGRCTKGLNKCVVQDNRGEIAKKQERIRQNMYFFYGIALMLFFISLLHITNSMKHQVQSRRYEFGILRAMGITEQGFCKILIREGMFYGIVTSVCMAMLVLISKAVLAGMMQHILRYVIVDQNIPLFPCLGMILVNIAVCVAVMLASGKELWKKNIIEELKCI